MEASARGGRLTDTIRNQLVYDGLQGQKDQGSLHPTKTNDFNDNFNGIYPILVDRRSGNSRLTRHRLWNLPCPSTVHWHADALGTIFLLIGVVSHSSMDNTCFNVPGVTQRGFRCA